LKKEVAAWQEQRNASARPNDMALYELGCAGKTEKTLPDLIKGN
jgi:hypothetical protein